MESFQKLHNIAKENKVNFEELCMYALADDASKEVFKTQMPKNT